MTQQEARARWRENLRATLPVFSLFLLALASLVLGHTIFASLGQSAAVTMPTGDALAPTLTADAVMSGVLGAALVLMALSSRPDLLGAQLPDDATRRGRFATLAAISSALVLVLLIVGMTGAIAGAVAAGDRAGAQPSAADWFASFTLGQVALSSLYAALAEELVLVAAPVLVAGTLHALAPRTWRGPRLAWLVVGGFVGLALRATMHAYQGGASVVAALVWGAAMLAAFLVWRSVYPLVLAHFAYDFAVAGLAPRLPDAWPVHVAVVVAGVVGAVYLLRAARRQ